MYHRIKIPLGDQPSNPHLTFSTEYNLVSTEELSVNYQHFESFHLATNCMNTKTGLGRKVWMRTRYYVTVDGRQTYWDTIVDLKEGDRFVHVSGLVSISVE